MTRRNPCRVVGEQSEVSRYSYCAWEPHYLRESRLARKRSEVKVAKVGTLRCDLATIIPTLSIVLKADITLVTFLTL